MSVCRDRPRGVPPGELAGREDRRRDPVITIDPDDAKDFDDAICLERVSRDQWRLWVHIADVSHYVKPGTALDTEARKLTLRHGPIANLGMSPMTMVFQVAEPRLLEGLKPGDRVRFRAERVGGQFTVVAVEVVP